MSASQDSSRDRWVLAAIVVSESAWAFSLAGVAGVALRVGGSPLDWPSVVAVLGLALLVRRVVRANVFGAEISRLVRPVLGAAVVYSSVAAQIATGTLGFDFWWGARLATGSLPEGSTLTAMTGTVFGALMWWRGARLAVVGFPTDSLAFSFRLGLLALALATTVDILHSANLQIFPMVFVFFASGLGGLSIGHLLPEANRSNRSGMLPRVIAGTVSSILLVGLAVSLVHRDTLSDLSSGILGALSVIGKGLFWAIVIPVTYIYNVFVAGIIAFFDRVYSPSGTVPRDDFSLQIRRFEETEEGSEAFSFVMQLIEWVFLTLVALFLLYLLVWTVRRLLRSGPGGTAGKRLSVRKDGRLALDSGRLLLKLLPDWAGQRRRKRKFRLPNGPPGVVAALRVYYDLLIMADDNGLKRRPHNTAVEFQGTLARLFPTRLVRLATVAFDRACYGNYSPADEQIAEMRTSLAAVKQQKR